MPPNNDSWQRQAVVFGIWTAYLSYGMMDVGGGRGGSGSGSDEDYSSFYDQDIMIQSVLTFIMPLKLTQLILWRNIDDNTDGSDSSNNNNKEEEPPPVDWWKDLLKFVGSFLYYALPVSKSKKDKDNTSSDGNDDDDADENTKSKNDNKKSTTWAIIDIIKQLFTRNIEYIVVIVGKLIMIPVINGYARRIMSIHPTGGYQFPTPLGDSSVGGFVGDLIIYFQLLGCFMSSIMCGTWLMDLQCVVINVLSLGQYEMLPFNNYPIMSITASAFWGKRYNSLIHTLLKETVYTPVRKYYKYSAKVSILASFTVSGILHIWVCRYTFGRDAISLFRSFIYFLVQAIWIIYVEQKYSKNIEQLPTLIRRSIAFLFLFGTFPIYFGLFVEGYPQWLNNNESGAIRLPYLEDISKYLLMQLSVKQEYWIW